MSRVAIFGSAVHFRVGRAWYHFGYFAGFGVRLWRHTWPRVQAPKQGDWGKPGASFAAFFDRNGAA